MRDEGKQQNILGKNIDPAEYDRILQQSSEFLVGKKRLGPYAGFGLSNIHGTLTTAIGYFNSIKYLINFIIVI